MRQRFRKLLLSVIVLAVGAAAPSAVQAVLIGVHFPGNPDTTTAFLGAAESAGVPGFEQANWNSADSGGDAAAIASGATGDLVRPNAGVLTDSDGNTVTTTVEWAAADTWENGPDWPDATLTPDAKLMHSHVDAIGEDIPFTTVSFAGISFSVYDAIVYFGSDVNGRTGAVTDGTTTFFYSTFSNDPRGVGGFDPLLDYRLTDESSSGNPPSNYAIFSGLTASTTTFDIIRGSFDSGIYAVQIIDRTPTTATGIPEPVTAAYAGLAVVGLLAALRRRCRAD